MPTDGPCADRGDTHESRSSTARRLRRARAGRGCRRCCCLRGNVAASEPLDPAAAQRFATLALACVHKEYPNKIAHVLSGDADVQPPRELTPAFYGCYDWHSAVHAHWLLARIARRFPGSETANAARAALAVSLTPENIGPEVDYMRGQGRTQLRAPVRARVAAGARRRAA